MRTACSSTSRSTPTRRDRRRRSRRSSTEVCPVNIFAAGDGGALQIVEENLDECMLCELCIEAAPAGTVKVRKLYDGGAEL